MTVYHRVPKYGNTRCRCTTSAEVCGSVEANLNTDLGKVALQMLRDAKIFVVIINK